MTITAPQLTANNIPPVIYHDVTTTDDDGNPVTTREPDPRTVVITKLTRETLGGQTIPVRWQIIVPTTLIGNVGRVDLFSTEALQWRPAWNLDINELDTPPLPVETDDRAAKAASYQTIMDALAERLETMFG